VHVLQKKKREPRAALPRHKVDRIQFTRCTRSYKRSLWWVHQIVASVRRPISYRVWTINFSPIELGLDSKEDTNSSYSTGGVWTSSLSTDKACRWVQTAVFPFPGTQLFGLVVSSLHYLCILSVVRGARLNDIVATEPACYTWTWQLQQLLWQRPSLVLYKTMIGS